MRPAFAIPPAVLLLAAGALALAWHDVLPGGWTLRGWVEPHAERRAREVAERRAERLAIWRAENAARAPGAVVFLGSSTIERFPLERCFPGARAVNRGLADEDAAGLAERLAASLPPGPAALVVYAGGPDVHLAGRGPAEVRARVERVLERARAAAPRTPLALVGILSGRELDAAARARLAAVNSELRALAAERGAAFVDTSGPPLCDAEGRLAAELTTDGLHLAPPGYDELARRIVEQGGEAGRLLAP